MRLTAALICVFLGFAAVSRAAPEGEGVAQAQAQAQAQAEVPPEVRLPYAQMLKWRFTNLKRALAQGNAALDLMAAPQASAWPPQFKLNLIIVMAHLHWQARDNEKTTVLINQGLKIAEISGNRPARRTLQWMQAEIAFTARDIPSASRIAAAVLEDSRRDHDRDAEIEALNLLGKCETEVGHFPQAMQDLHLGLALVQEPDKLNQRSKLLWSLATFYLRATELDKALTTVQEALRLARQAGDLPRIARILFRASDIETHLHHEDAEIADLRAAEAIGESLENPDILKSAEIDISDSLLVGHDYAGALAHANRGLILSQQLEDRVGIATAMINQGIALNHLGEHARGLAGFEEGLKYFVDTQSNAQVAEITGDLAQEYAFAGVYQKAFEAEEKFKELNDQLYHDSNSKSLQALEFRYQSEKQDREIAQLTAQNEHRQLTRKFGMVASVLSLALIGALLARFRLLRQSARKLKMLNDQLEVLSFTDSLTGLRNRRFFFQNVDRYTEDADRAHSGIVRKPQKDHEFLIFYIIDLDHFKQVNDTYGHHAGDLVLVQAVERLRAVIRGSDDLIRWGGEEFLFVARHSSLEDGPRVAERLRTAIESAQFDLGDGKLVTRTCSIGFAFYPLVVHMPGRPNWEAVVALADQALYAAKAAGRNGWVGASAREDVTVEALEIGLAGGLQELAQKGLCVLQSSFLGEAKVVYQ